MAPPEPWRPLVTIVIPALNEKKAVTECLQGFIDQDWPREQLEIIVVDGRSTDGSLAAVEEFASSNPSVRVLDNPKGSAASGFNRGIAAARGEVLCLFSAHGMPARDFLAKAVATLQDTEAAGVSGPIGVSDNATPRQRAIGLALLSPFGMASTFRYSKVRRDVETIGHPVYRRSAIDSVGAFDESLGRNSDFQYNWRLRQKGFRLMTDPDIHSSYVPRAGLRALASQYWQYGRWKAVVIRRHPESIRLRQLAPPAWTLWLLAAPLLVQHRFTRTLLGTSLLAYGIATGTMCYRISRDTAGHEIDLSTVALAFPTMHLSWGLGLLAGTINPPDKAGS